jgi:hypothetical protein
MKMGPFEVCIEYCQAQLDFCGLEADADAATQMYYDNLSTCVTHPK